MKTAIVTTLLLAGGLAGCTTDSPPISWPRQNMSPAQRNFEANWIATHQILHEYGFKVARADRRARLILSEPLIGQSAGEFWRKDAVTFRDAAESSIQTIYRTANVELRPAVMPDDYEPLVLIRVARSDKPERRIRTTNDAYSMFRQAPEKWAASQPAAVKSDLVEQLPNDKRLADELALHIRARAYRLLQENPPRTYPK